LTLADIQSTAIYNRAIAADNQANRHRRPAALVQLATDMDDLTLQFDGTDAGKRFIEAWKRARIIVDTGGGHGNGGTPPTPPTPPATPKP
jgi:hypothetical protein